MDFYTGFGIRYWNGGYPGSDGPATRGARGPVLKMYTGPASPEAVPAGKELHNNLYIVPVRNQALSYIS